MYISESKMLKWGQHHVIEFAMLMHDLDEEALLEELVP